VSKIKEINFTGSIIIFFVLLFAYSKWGPAIPIYTLTQQKGEPLMVTGEGSVNVSPDVAKITLGFEEQGQVLKQVQDEVNQKSKNLTKELKKIGIDDKYIKTVSYSVYPIRNYNSPTNNITGYSVSTFYEVEIEDFEKINNVLLLASQVGVNNIGNISFEVNDETKEEKTQEARKIAVDKAKQKAEGLSKASGITLGKIININENSANNFPQPLYTTRDLEVETPNSTSPSIEPGETKISVTISLSYEVR
jgi:uncharacterized protein YggE